MYDLIEDKVKEEYSKDVFTSRNKSIYSGIEAKNITVDNIEIIENKGEIAKLKYNMQYTTMPSGRHSPLSEESESLLPSAAMAFSSHRVSAESNVPVRSLSMSSTPAISPSL